MEQLYDYIRTYLKEQYAAGATYQQLAKKFGISYTYIHKLISGECPPERLSLEFFRKIFPNSKIELGGDTIVHGNTNNVNGCGGAQTITNNAAEGMITAIRRVMHDAVMSDAQKVATAKIICGEEKD